MREEPSFLPSGRRRQQEAVEVLQQLLAVASVDRLSFLVWTVREPVCDLPVSDVAAPVELQGRPATTEPAFAERAWSGWSAHLDAWCGPGARGQHRGPTGRLVRVGSWTAPGVGTSIILTIETSQP